MRAFEYHESTKHHFGRFARALGYLDWATQPDPFRRYAGAPLIALRREPLATDVPYAALFDGSAPRVPLTDHAVGEFLRCSMGLSAWKQYGGSRPSAGAGGVAPRWALRVNPSSGNLHPTEAYIVRDGRVSHYAPREHALEERGAAALPPVGDGFLVALTSIHWREAWKYGERAFRYCQHDCGHALGALRFAAALLGWRMTLLSDWPHAGLAALLGVDRDGDFVEAEREEPECIALVACGADVVRPNPDAFAAAARAGTWQGRANRLSPAHPVDWPAIDDVAAVTRR